MKAEEYIKLLEIKFKDEVLFNEDEQRVMEWEEIVIDFLTFGDYENESIIDYVYSLTSRNSNCKFIGR